VTAPVAEHLDELLARRTTANAAWFEAEADRLLDRLQVARVAADPARVPGAGEPGGWRGLSYYRLHGSPRIYYSPYSPEALSDIADQLVRDTAAGAETWCIFDNTAAFSATKDAITTKGLTESRCRGITDQSP
jgi:uncharacterized protein YecE (DUF72 family)